jgi:hypothetical protein
MRVWVFVAAVTLLQACQMGLPVEQNNTETNGPVAVDAPSAEANLAAAFEQAALAATVDPAPKKKRLFGFLKPDAAPEAVLAGTDIEVVDGAQTGLEQKVEVQLGDVDAASNTAPQTSLDAEGTENASPQEIVPVLESATPVRSGLGGLLGLLKPKHTNAQTQAALKAPAPETTPDAGGAPPSEAALTVLETEDPSALPLISEPKADEAKVKKPKFGLFKPKAGSKKSRKTSLSTVALGEELPFGIVGISCDVRKGDMGKQVDQFPREGRAAWTLFDTNPASTAPRTQFITGFKDGCTRQVTAALILFGAPSLHEVHRYSKSQSKAAWSRADDSYEVIKSKVCGVARKTPCPSGKLGELAKDMAFVSVYKQFGDATGWLELLLYDGVMTTEQLR